MGYLVPVFISLGLFAMLSVISVALSTNRRQQIEAKFRADVQNKLLDRFGSSKEFVDFLQSDGGEKFLSPVVASSPVGPREKVISAIKTGVIMAFLGGGFAMASSRIDDDGMMVPALLLMMLGLGFVVSGLVSQRLATSLGLIQKREGDGE